MTKEELFKQLTPFDVIEKGKRKRITVEGFTENDPLGVGGRLFPNMPTAYFKDGGWLLVESLLDNYDLAL